VAPSAYSYSLSFFSGGLFYILALVVKISSSAKACTYSALLAKSTLVTAKRLGMIFICRARSIKLRLVRVYRSKLPLLAKLSSDLEGSMIPS
jgi:hypothetical protein